MESPEWWWKRAHTSTHLQTSKWPFGDTVVWVNVGGSHDVNGDISALTGESYGNPEAFSLSVASGGTPEAPTCIGSYTFTVPGVYNYDCSVGNHASLGMVATVTVGTGGCTDSTATNYNARRRF